MISFRFHNEGSKYLKTISFLLIIVAVFSYIAANAEAGDVNEYNQKIDVQRIIGRWARPDGGYILEFKEFGNDGTLKAAYFNPSPINVSRAEFRYNKDAMTIFVELRDVNYPGSAYNLIYDPKTDRLIGTYFQAVEKETYNIEFIRLAN